MVEQQVPSIMRDFVATLAKGDVEKTLAFFTDDAVWVTPDGTFKGKDELRRYLTWLGHTIKDMAITESGTGVMAQGNSGSFEHVIRGTIEGVKGEVLAWCAYEFSGGKIKQLRTIYDRLSIAQQVAKGWLPRWLVGMIVRRLEKGLR